MKRKCRFGIGFCALAVLGSAPFAHAISITGSMHEPFAYVDATLFPNPPPDTTSRNLGQGWNVNGDLSGNAANASWADGGLLYGGAAAGTFKTANTPGLTSSATGYLAASGNKLTLDAATPNANQNMGRRLGGQDIDAGTTYFSLLISKNVDTMRTINMSFHGGATNTERFAIGQIGAAAGNTAGNIAMLMNNSNPGGLVQAATPIAMGVGVTHLIVGKIEWNAGGFETVSLWVDPANVTTEALAGAVYVSTNLFELTSISSIRPFVGNTVATPAMPAVSANFDEIRIGGSWEAVTSLVVVPEPASLGLVAAGVAGLVGRRGRKIA